MKVTFLEHTFPLCKTINEKTTTPYPLAKNFTSHEYVHDVTQDGVRQRFEVIRKHANAGHALLKGNLLAPLIKEPRANKADKEEATQSVVIDFDNVELPLLANLPRPLGLDSCTQIAEKLITFLPQVFHDATYIAHASSSLGTKATKVSLHLEFFLTIPVAPRALRSFLTAMNFEDPTLDSLIGLSASATALTFALDPSIGENSRIIYIAPPKFLGVDDPVNPEARLFIREKKDSAIDITPAILELDDNKVKTQKDTKRTKLRKLRGLGAGNFKTQTLRVDGKTFNVVTNPDHLEMELYAEYDEFICYNVNHGDSHAYYVRRDNPNVVWNFKGEPPFAFAKANPEAYEEHMRLFITTPQASGKETGSIPFVFRDQQADEYFNGLFDISEGAIEFIAPARRGALDEFMAQYGGLMPDPILSCNYQFEPNDPRVLDIPNGFVNKFTTPPLLRKSAMIDVALQNRTIENITQDMQSICPSIYTIVYSAVGSCHDTAARFINWVAYIVKYREPTQTAWILNGVSGAGKGVLFHQILRPIFSQEYSTIITGDSLREAFNGWAEKNFIVFVDEFKANGNDTQSRQVTERLKTLITEPTVSVRNMRANQRNAKNFCNFILATNERNFINVDAFDRRYNICLRQNKSLIESIGPTRLEAVLMNLPTELSAFVSYLSLLQIDVAKVRQVISNESSEKAKAQSIAPSQEFAQAILDGDMEYFTQVLEIPYMPNNDYLSTAQLAMKTILRDIRVEDGQPQISRVRSDTLMALYNVLVGKCDTSQKFNRIVGLHGVDAPKRLRVKGTEERIRGFEINWDMDLPALLAYQEEYLESHDIIASKDPKTIQHFQDHLPELLVDRPFHGTAH